MDSQKIKTDIEETLYWDPRVDSTKIEVEVEKEKATLKGTINSYSSKIAAVNDAWSVFGVLDVESKLNIKYPTTDTLPSDSELEKNIEKSLLWDPFIDSKNINVSVENGKVTLEGNVNEYWKIKKVERKADIVGVIDIINKLTVTPTQSVLDKDIAKDVTNAIDRNTNVDIDNINIKVKNGNVTLSGTVNNRNAFNAAESSAYYTLGVREVNNNLAIKY
ncbi:BON domain-containing protein [Candidatus Dojkabacteria bacterium]|nr:BON domain-containing protein [Candidatus Dojkabacteria bacterium]